MNNASFLSKEVFEHYHTKKQRTFYLSLFFALFLRLNQVKQHSLWTLLDLAVHWENVWKFVQALCCFGTQTPWFWLNARLFSSVFGFDHWMMKATKNYWGRILWFFKNKTLPIQGLCSVANASCVMCKNWGDFQRIVGSQFMWTSQRICQQPGLIENFGKGMDLGVELSHIKLC